MRAPYLISAAVVSIGLYGCAPAPLAPPLSPLHSGSITMASIPAGALPCDVTQPTVVGNCVIELTVTDDATNPKGCSIKLVREDSDLITLKGAQDNFLYWRIVGSPNYKFTRDGIAFIDNFRPRVFSEGERGGADDNEYQWKFTGNKRRVNGYVISVRKPGSSTNPARECELDPWVRNK